MPNADSFLFVEPLQHLIAYSSYVLHEIVSSRRIPGVTMIELRGFDATPSRIDRVLEEYDPILFVATGHGLDDRYTSECMQLYMASGDERVKRMRDRVVLLCSCLTAKELGPNLIENGALAYYGSRDELWFFVGRPPGVDRSVKSVFYCEFQPIISLMEGKTTGEAQQDRIKKYEEEIEYWTTGPGKDHPDAPLVTNMLIIDKNIATFLGKEDVRIAAEGAVVTVTPAGAPVPAAIFGLAAIIAGSVTLALLSGGT